MRSRKNRAARSAGGRDAPLGGKDIEAEAERLLAGGGRPPEAGELFALIHAINPSSRPGLSERERQRLYATKSRLQSLLILAYRDALEVQRIAGKPHLVGLQHRFVRADACHAILERLDPSARDWVESQLAMQ